MGKLGNNVAQLLTSAAPKTGAGDAATVLATAPTAFAVLLSNVAAPINVPGVAATEPMPAALPIPSDAPVEPNPDLLVADLPLTEIPRAIPPKFAQSDGPAAAIASERTSPPKSTSIDESAQDDVTASPEEDAPKSLDVAITISPEATIPMSANANTPAPAVPDNEGDEQQRSATSAPQRMAAAQLQADTTVGRSGPKPLPPEFAAALAASKASQTKPVVEKREQSATKMPALKVDPLIIATAASAKDAAASPVVKAENLRVEIPDVSPDTAPPASANAQPQPVTAPGTLPSGVSAGPVADLSSTLGQQVIDMGSGGQWIDGLAREIASLSKGAGHGSFRLSPEHLGPMRVDIRPGDQGANVTLTVETEAAESMLLQDRNILKADAQLAAVKIGDVTVERVAQVREPGRSDTATGQGTGQGQSQTPSQTPSQGSNGQGSNNAALAQGQGQSQNNGNHAGNRKVSPDAVVSSQAEPRAAGERDIPDSTRRARYA